MTDRKNMRFIAPAGTRLSVEDLVIGGLRGALASSSDDLANGLCAATDRRCATLFSTGRAAMTVCFEAMKLVAADASRNEVIIPGYTCYSVPAAVERAGLIPRLCDIDPTTLSPDLNSLAGVDLRRVLAIVSANLYGLPNALTELEEFARTHQVFMLDDAAQALGARLGGRAVGGFGDVGLLSFDKGKNITTLHGGCLVANPGPLQEAIESVMGGVARPSWFDTSRTAIKLGAYALLLRPSLYSLVRYLPLGLGLTPYETDYPIVRFNRGLAGFAMRQLERLAEINGVRVMNAGRIRRYVTSVDALETPVPVHGADAVYARFPVLVDPSWRASLIRALELAGIGATASYPRALIDVPEVALRLPRDQLATPGARRVAERIITLPTHGYVPPDIGERIVAVIRTVADS